MARAVGTSIENNFVNGLVTEATGMNFPESAVTETFNCVFDRRGIVKRRLGIDIEENATPSAVNATDCQYVKTTFTWETVGEDGDVTFVVVQIGKTLHFYEVDDEDNLSDQKKSFTVDLATYKSASQTDNTIRANKCAFSSGNGKLFVAHKDCNPFYVEYDSSGDSISVTSLTLKIRDFEGMEDGLDTDERPTTLTLAHEYNLHNQGWGGRASIGGGGGIQNPIAKWDTDRTDFPSNADIWWLYKDSSEQFTPGWVFRVDVGNSPAAKGHNILDAFDIERIISYPPGISAPTGTATTSLPETVDTYSTDNRPVATEFFASRAWWGGVNDPKFASNIYFSKVIEQDSDYEKCYQVNDPTTEVVPDLLPTDGGVVVIPDLARCVYMKAINNTLLVFATNGIWAISGSEFDGFQADSYRITKVSDFPVPSAYSFVLVDNIPVWWSKSGIYTLQASEVDKSSFQVVSLTDTKIRSFYRDIPLESKLYAQGAYDEVERVVSWIYGSVASLSFEAIFQYDRILNLDLTTGAFYVDSITNTNLRICGIQSVQGVIDGVQKDSIQKFLLYGVAGTFEDDIVWAEKWNTDYVDMYSLDDTGVDYSSYFVSGYRVRGEGHRNFQNDYLTVVSQTEADSSFLVSGWWGWSNSSDSNLWTIKQQGYSPKTYQDYSTRKLKIRGNGPCLQFRVESESGAPFNIVAFVTQDSVNQQTG